MHQRDFVIQISILGALAVVVVEGVLVEKVLLHLNIPWKPGEDAVLSAVDSRPIHQTHFP